MDTKKKKKKFISWLKKKSFLYIFLFIILVEGRDKIIICFY